MTDRPAVPDEELLDQLRSAQDRQLPVPENMIDLIMTGYDISNIDAAVAALVEDASLAEAGAVRDDDSDLRLLSFEHADLSIECEVRGVDRRVLGHVDAGGPGSLHLDDVEGSETTALDELGGFEFVLRSSRAFRLRWEPEDGGTVVTEWVVP